MGICCVAQTMDDSPYPGWSPGRRRHNDTAQRVLIEKIDLSQRLTDGMVDFPRLREGGIHVPFFALWYRLLQRFSGTPHIGVSATRMQGVFDKYLTRSNLLQVHTDIERIVREKKIAAVLTAEGGHQIDDDPGYFDVRRLGILSMTLTHFAAMIGQTRPLGSRNTTGL
jgi:membrane dipeptidase